MAYSRAVCVCTVFLVVACATAEDSLHPLSDEFISLINSRQNSWTAGRNFPKDTSLTYIKGLMGARKDPLFHTLPVKTHDPELIASLPEEFDPRRKWPNCTSLNDIRDQGSCGSCWAFGAVEAMTDRVCTYSNGTKNFYFSAQDLVSCYLHESHGCFGGFPRLAWKYWHDVGIVSGGPYNSSQGCIPYAVAPCDHSSTKGKRPPCRYPQGTPDCVKKCEAGYNVDYNHDKHRSKNSYQLITEEQIKAELYTNGPVEAVFTVYEDFLQYKTGVYSHQIGIELGLHAIKLMAWGVENGTKYWLCANSWNTDWGDKGYFKILRGVDDCHIEDEVLAGEPDLSGF